MNPLCIQSQFPWRKGWQFVCCTGDPDEARMWAKTSLDSRCAGEVAADSGRSTPARSNGTCPVVSCVAIPADPEAVAVRRLGAHRGVQALVDEGVLRREEEVLHEHRRSRVGQPATHQCAKALPLASSCTGVGCAWRCGSCRSRSATSMSARSWVKPRRTTTRSAARSVRFSGKVYAGTCQPRSRRASRRRTPCSCRCRPSA